MTVDFNSLALWVSAAVASIYTILRINHRSTHKLPPGPKGLPFFGSYFSLSAKPWNDFGVWKKQYGTLTSITLLVHFAS